MRLTRNKTGNGTSYYVIRSITRDGKRSSEVVERLGTDREIMETYGCDDPEAWAQARVDELNAAEKEKVTRILVPLDTNKQIPVDQRNTYNVGYLFLQQIYYDLGLPNICARITKRHSFEYDLDSILSRLVYGRILYPSSKRSCFEQSASLMEPADFDLHQIYRALSVLAEESDEIQADLYKNSKRLTKRQTGILYYDCTNYFFETETADGLRQYGVSKEHRPSPIVQMGMFMDKTGMPLAFCVNPGNTNEQTTLTPLERKIMKDFELSEFVVCTDAGLSSADNRMFNNFGSRSFITTQSIKKLPSGQKEWCLQTDGWRLPNDSKEYDISKIEDTEENRSKTFYKQLFIEGYDEKREIDFDQTLIVTYSLKYRNYQRAIREEQLTRAVKAAARGKAGAEKHNPNDYRRFIRKTSVTSDGEIAEKQVYGIDQDAIEKEAAYDGFYAVMTNLDDNIEDIIAVNHGRWKIEESFRIMKSEFEARPVYLSRDDRIRAHFLTCFISLMIYRILEKKLDKKYTCDQIIKTLRSMNMARIGDEGYIPAYTRTPLTDDLHKEAGFRTDYELIRKRKMKGICRQSKQ